MDLKASRKRQLAAAVTLAVMGMAWVSVPQQVWAKTGDAGAIDKPLTLAEYELKNATGGAIDTLRKDLVVMTYLLPNIIPAGQIILPVVI